MLPPNLNKRKFVKLLEKYDSTISLLSSWGIKVRQQSRLWEYRKDLKFLADGRLPSSVVDWYRISFSVIEADEIADIVYVEKDAGPPPAILTKLRTLAKDTLVRTNSKQSPGRSYQLELYLRALTLMSGMSCSVSSPDLIVSISGDKLQIEVKRPLSEKNIYNIIKKGLRQLSSKRPGILILSLDHIIFGDASVVTLKESETPEIGQKFIDNKISLWTESVRPRVDEMLRGKGSAAALLFLTKVPIFQNSLDKMSCSSHFRLILLNGFSDSNTRSLIEIYCEAIGKIWGRPTF